MTVKNTEAPKTENAEDFGFVGYRDYKQSDFYKRYEAARAKMPAQVYAEVTKDQPDVEPQKRCGVGRSVVVIIFGLIYIALSVIGYFLNTTSSVLGSLFSVFNGKDAVTCVLDMVEGGLSIDIDTIGAIAVLVSIVLALFAVIGGIVAAARGRGIGKLMKTGCGLMFLCVVAALAIVIVRRLDATIGLAALVIIGGIMTICVITAPKKIKERK